MWEHCPFASDDVLALAPAERPVCAYESAEYEEALEAFETDAASSTANPVEAWFKDHDAQDSSLPGNDGSEGGEKSSNPIRENPPDPRTHSLALLQVMVSRAAAALSVLPLTDTVTSESDSYHMHTTKVHAALEAFLRLSREHRATLAQYHRDRDRERKAEAEANENGRPLSLADLAKPLLEETDGIMEYAIEVEENRQKALEKFAEENIKLKAEFERLTGRPYESPDDEEAAPEEAQDHGASSTAANPAHSDPLIAREIEEFRAAAAAAEAEADRRHAGPPPPGNPRAP